MFCHFQSKANMIKRVWFSQSNDATLKIKNIKSKSKQKLIYLTGLWYIHKRENTNRKTTN